MNREEIDSLLARVRGVGAFREVLSDEAVRAMMEALDSLASGSEVAGAFGRLWAELASGTERLLPDAWQSRLVGAILDSESVFGRRAERGEVGPVLVEQAGRDLSALRSLFDLEAEELLTAAEGVAPELEGAWTPWREPERVDGPAPRRDLAEKLAGVDDWGRCAGLLAEHFRRHGAGIFGRYRAFRWREGSLGPVGDPDLPGALIGYERERRALAENTERLLSGRPSQHALLYGPPGTGKSSTVKALLEEYHEHGLRLVEVAKEDLGELPRVLSKLRGRGPRFIVFVDDLSFEEREVEYKALKALLEGSIESPPENVRLYATSNRRNLIRETFSERDGGSPDDVHARDTEREKLSLAARFGLRVTFLAPDQEKYLEIVRGLARERGLEVPEEDLVEAALARERWSAGRSGRTARQFVDELEAEG